MKSSTWDKYSDQPYIIHDKAFKQQQKQKYFLEYLWMFILFVCIFPIAFIGQFLIPARKTNMQIGIGVNLDKGEVQYDLVKELNIKHLLIRLPLWDIKSEFRRYFWRALLRRLSRSRVVEYLFCPWVYFKQYYEIIILLIYNSRTLSNDGR